MGWVSFQGRWTTSGGKFSRGIDFYWVDPLIWKVSALDLFLFLLLNRATHLRRLFAHTLASSLDKGTRQVCGTVSLAKSTVVFSC